MDLTTFDAKDFYAQMRSGVKVTTSQIPPQRYIDVLTPLLEAGEDVLFVSMSSGISGSYASGQIAARQLREEFPDRKSFWSTPTAHRWARACLSCARRTAAAKG